MKTLIFRNGVSAEFTENSTIYDLVNVFTQFEEIDGVRALLTAENLVGATFDGEPVVNVIPVETVVSAPAGENVTVHYLNRPKTDLEILQETQDQQDDVINYLLMR